MQKHISADFTLSLTRAFASPTPALTIFQSGPPRPLPLPREKSIAGVRSQSALQPSPTEEVSYAAG